jgi:alkylation response protein AidB-like acyl-CoA dehydrogenase
VTRLLYLRVRWKAELGDSPGVEGSMAKLFATEAAQRHFADALDLLGPAGVLPRHTPAAPHGGAFEAGFRAAAVGTIYGGSSEIMRGIIAERGLGLPRKRNG